MSDDVRFRLAAIQAAAVPFDREASTDKTCGLVRSAGAMRVTIAAFGKTWLPGYPLSAILSAMPLTWRATAEYKAAVERLARRCRVKALELLEGALDAIRQSAD